MHKRFQAHKPHAAFTIVELLIVIVVIGILAAITIVAYNGVRQRAIQASLQADIDKAKKKIMLYHAENGAYPTAINCTNPTVTETCVQPSGSNTYFYITDNPANPQSFALAATSGDYTYQATESTPPGLAQGVVTNGLMVYLDAGSQSSYSDPGTVWGDISGNGRDTALYNVTYSSESGGVLLFDGTSSYAKVPSTAVQSIFMFVNIDSAQSGTNRYLIDARPGVGSGYLYTQSRGDWINLRANNLPVTNWWASIPKDVWVGFYAETAALYTSTINLMSRFSNTEFLKGKLGMVTVYNHKLTQAEILQNYTTFKTRYGLD